MKWNKIDVVVKFTILTTFFLVVISFVVNSLIPTDINNILGITKFNLVSDILIENNQLSIEDSIKDSRELSLHVNDLVIKSDTVSKQADVKVKIPTHVKVDVDKDVKVDVDKDVEVVVVKKNVEVAVKIDSKSSIEELQKSKEVKESDVVSKKSMPLSVKMIDFEDFTPNGSDIEKIRAKLLNSQSTQNKVRFAFIGDSFIEGDIITADIRNKLQARYGGRGVGFVPITSVSSKYRSTIKHKFDDWNKYTSTRPKKSDKSKFMLSGKYFVPEEDATVSYACSTRDSLLSSSQIVRLIFINEGQISISASINGEPAQVFTPSSSSYMQSIDFEGDISTLDLSFRNVEGFVAYGVVFDDRTGVSVDNFSLRGSSGSGLLLATKERLLEFRKILDYDVIVLQYGLNVVSPKVTNYNYYKRQMLSIIRQLKDVYPESAIVVMSVSDRGVKVNGDIVTMTGIEPMVKTQREVAKAAGVLFWNTYEAMGGRNSIESFVLNEPALASRDYTHINKAGGKRIATIFIEPLLSKEI